MHNYYEEIEHIIIKNETNKRVRMLEDNYDTLNNYWNIGRLIVEAQGGKIKAKYGNQLIKNWSIDFTAKYGKGYDASNLKRFRQFYFTFSISATVWHQLSWSHIKAILPIKEKNKRNYYIKLCIKNNLSSRELIKEIKLNSYERLKEKPDKIDIIQTKDKLLMVNDLKDPIIIKINQNEIINNEKELELKILSQ